MHRAKSITCLWCTLNCCRMWTLAEEQPETWQPVANPLPSDCRCVFHHHLTTTLFQR